MAEPLKYSDFFDRSEPAARQPPEMYVPPADEIPQVEPAPPPLPAQTPLKRLDRLPEELTDPASRLDRDAEALVDDGRIPEERPPLPLEGEPRSPIQVALDRAIVRPGFTQGSTPASLPAATPAPAGVVTAPATSSAGSVALDALRRIFGAPAAPVAVLPPPQPAGVPRWALAAGAVALAVALTRK